MQGNENEISKRVGMTEEKSGYLKKHFSNLPDTMIISGVGLVRPGPEGINYGVDYCYNTIWQFFNDPYIMPNPRELINDVLTEIFTGDGGVLVSTSAQQFFLHGGA